MKKELFMQKNNYFELLEELASLSTRAVFLTSSSTRTLIQQSLCELEELQAAATERICRLESSLFNDFLPPLERHSIAEVSHSIGRVIEKSCFIVYQKSLRAGYDKKAKVNDVCLTLAEHIEDSIKMLKKIKKPNHSPRLAEFRKELLSARKASRAPQKRQGSLNTLLGELREELSDCFDKIIEIMLCNI